MKQSKTKTITRKKMGKVIGEFKAGELKSSSGDKVVSPKQAIAIALSEAKIKTSKKPISETKRKRRLAALK